MHPINSAARARIKLILIEKPATISPIQNQSPIHQKQCKKLYQRINNKLARAHFIFKFPAGERGRFQTPRGRTKDSRCTCGI